MATTKKTTPAETKEAAVKTAEAVAAEVKTDAEKKAPAKKEAAKKETAKKETVKKTAAKKPAAKKEAPKAAEKKAPAKKTTKKKGLAYEDVVAAAKKKLAAADLTRIKYPIAANVELNGAAEGIFYIYIDEANNISVEPYKYNDYDIEFRADTDAFVAVMNGKKNVYDALAEGLIKVSGNVKKAILLINAAL
ncbi:MAG: SCP2 sterol-binding domain-containing protein [Oscillospiraceae bacterium]|nr:SCP2 sterol-binding domain-containing protein [Oscillospiraceae bacterium]